MLCLFLSGCKQDCIKEPCPEKPQAIALESCSPHLQKLIQNHKSHIRGLKVGMPLSGINESDSNFVSKTSFYTSYDPDLSDQDFAIQVDGSQNSIDQFFSTLPFLKNPISSNKIRRFAKSKLSMKVKMKSILNEINIG